MLPAHLRPEVCAAVEEVHVALAALYGDRLARVVLYGSQARGDARDDSDVDLLVVLRGAVDVLAEIRRMAPLATELILRYGVVCSFQPYEEAAASEPTAFLQSAAADGVEL